MKHIESFSSFVKGGLVAGTLLGSSINGYGQKAKHSEIIHKIEMFILTNDEYKKEIERINKNGFTNRGINLKANNIFYSSAKSIKLGTAEDLAKKDAEDKINKLGYTVGRQQLFTNFETKEVVLYTEILGMDRETED